MDVKKFVCRRGEPMIWLAGAGVAICIAMILGLLVLVRAKGMGFFWTRPLVLIDREAGVVGNRVNGPLDIEWGESTFPLYGRAALFDGDNPDRILKARGKCLDCRYGTKGRIVRRIGYDLFDEIRYLLTQGQPAAALPWCPS